jgi:hypothetical protein
VSAGVQQAARQRNAPVSVGTESWNIAGTEASQLSLDRCRRLIGRADLSDAQVIKLRDQMYALAKVVVDAFGAPGAQNGLSNRT